MTATQGTEVQRNGGGRQRGGGGRARAVRVDRREVVERLGVGQAPLGAQSLVGEQLVEDVVVALAARDVDDPLVGQRLGTGEPVGPDPLASREKSRRTVSSRSSATRNLAQEAQT